MLKLTTLALSAFLLLGATSLNGQTILPPEQSTDSMLINGVTTYVETALVSGNMDGVEDAAKDFVKEHLDQKLREQDQVWVAEKIVINQVTDKRGDLLIYLFNQNNRIRINMAFRLGYDVYVDPYQFPEEYQRMKGFLSFFVTKYYSEYLPDEIKKVEKEIKSKEREIKSAGKEMKRAAKDNKKLASRIKKNKKGIKKLEAKVKKMEEDNPELAEIQVEILEMKKEIGGYEDEISFNNGVVEVKESQLKELNKELSTLKAEKNRLENLLKEILTGLESYQ